MMDLAEWPCLRATPRHPIIVVGLYPTVQRSREAMLEFHSNALAFVHVFDVMGRSVRVGYEKTIKTCQ
jgi:hypothetical protein